jgi:hypothetical protein
MRLAGVHGAVPDMATARANLEADLSSHLQVTGEAELAALFMRGEGERAHAALVDATRRLAALFRTSSEARALTFVSRHDDAHVVSVCRTADRVRPLGTLDAVVFSLTCQITSDHDAATRELRVRAGGSFANVTFDGELVTLGGPPSERARFTSQSTVILGMGAVTGFELRGDEGQIAALELRGATLDEEKGIYEGRAWRLARGSQGWQNTVEHTLGMAYLFPWPTVCDARQRRAQ